MPRRAWQEAKGSPGEATLRFELSYLPPLDAGALLGALSRHDVPGLERTDPLRRCHTRVLRTPSGPLLIELSFGHVHSGCAGGRVEATVLWAAGGTDPELGEAKAEAAVHTGVNRSWLERLVRRWLDLDLDPALVVNALGADPSIGSLVQLRPGLRILGSPDGFEAAVRTVLGQQVSIAAGSTFTARLCAAYGEPLTSDWRAFPTPDALASVSAEALRRAVGITGARARTVKVLAEACRDGLDLNDPSDIPETRAALRALPGIGQWTVDYLSVRAFGDRDAFPAGDLVLRRSLDGASPGAAERMAERWRPYRAYAAFHIWTHSAYAGTSK